MSSSCPRLSISPFSGGKEEEIVERRGGGERKFLSLRCLPFSHLSLPFPPETPDTQAGVLGSWLWLSWCRSTTLLLLFLFLYCKTTCTHLFPLQCFTMNAKKTKQNQTKFLLVVQKLIEPACEMNLHFYNWRLAYVAMVPLILLERSPNCPQVMLVYLHLLSYLVF